MDRQQTMEFLKGIRLFQDLDTRQLAALADSVREVDFKAGELLFWENGPQTPPTPPRPGR